MSACFTLSAPFGARRVSEGTKGNFNVSLGFLAQKCSRVRWVLAGMRDVEASRRQRNSFLYFPSLFNFRRDIKPVYRHLVFLLF